VTNVEHLAQLEGDARAVAEEACRRFAGFVLVSSRRDIQGQAVAMAERVFRQRDWISATYKPSRAADLCNAWSMANKLARKHELAAAFAGILNALPVSELVKMSRHLAPVTAGAHAFDARPLLTERGKKQMSDGRLDPELTDEGLEVVLYLSAEAKARGGLFLMVEGRAVVHHWQARD
jgi:hypothetical protein